MDIFQITAIGIIGAILAITVKPYRPEFSMLISIVTGVLILFQIISAVSGVFAEFQTIIEKSGVDIRYFALVVKIIGIAYVTQFAAEICKDAGENSVALKVELAGKVFVMMLTMPIIAEFLQIIIGILQ